MSRTFTCAVCGRGYHTDTSEADMNREFLNSGMTNSGALLSACDECYTLVMRTSRGESRG